MKKTYIAPTVDLEELNGEDELLAASPNININNDYTITDDSQMGGKTHNIDLWSDDDE